MSARPLRPDLAVPRPEVPRGLLVALIVAGALGGSALMAARPSLGPFLPLIALGALLLLLRWPPLGLLAVLAGALSVPFTIGTGTESSINAGLILTGGMVAFWLLLMAVRPEVRLAGSRPVGVLLLLGGVSLLAFLVGLQSWLPFVETAPIRAQAGGLGVVLLSIGAFLLTAHLVHDARWLQAMVGVFLAIGAAYVAIRLVRSQIEEPVTVVQFGGDGSLFWTWLPVLAFSQAAFNRRLNLVFRLALGGLTALTFYAAMGLNLAWTSGWLPPLVAVVVALAIGAPRLSLPVLALGGAAVLLRWGAVDAALMGGDNEYSLMTRLEAWQILGQIVAINPILGLGFANYPSYTPLFPILGYAVAFNSHNNYVDLAAQTGLIGLGVFFWFTVETAVLGFRLRARVAPGFQRAYVVGALGGLAGTLAAGMLGDWVLPFVYNVGLAGFRASVLAWLFLGGLVALEQLVRREPSADVVPPLNRPATVGQESL